MRPASRGGGYMSFGSGGGGGGGPLRPMTGQRLGTGRLGTGRTGTGRLDTASQGLAALNTDVSVMDRPVTSSRHGLGAMGGRMGTAGQGRQLQDSTYFTSLLSRKTKEITDEIKRLKEEIDKLHKNNSAYQMLDRKYEDLIKDVRNMEGQLADYNLAMDKSRTGTDPQEIVMFNESLKQKNHRFNQEIDQVFMTRQEREKAVQDVENEITRVRKEMEDRIAQVSPTSLNDYRELVEEQARVMRIVAEGQAELEHVNAQIEQASYEVGSDRYRDECMRLERQLQQYREQQNELRMELRNTKMDPEEARAKLLSKVKEESERVTNIDKELEVLQRAISEKREAAESLSVKIQDRKAGGGNDAQKYELLFQRAKEMDAFLEQYSSLEKEEQEKQAGLRNNIVVALETISEGLGRKDHLPSREAVEEMRNELSFKERQIQSSNQTKSRLEEEFKKRQMDLEKINTLDQKIEVESASLKEKMDTMQQELSQFRDIETLKANAAETKEYLENLQREFSHRRDQLKIQIKQLSGRVERLRGQVFTHPECRSLESLEGRLRHQEQTIFSLRDYIEGKGKSTQYEHLKEECLLLTDQINSLVIKQQSTITPGSAMLASAAPY